MVLYLRQIQNPDRGRGPCPGSMFNITLLGPPGIAVNQDHYNEATIERKMATHIMMLWKYKPLN
jgi:hypothetical protein